MSSIRVNYILVVMALVAVLGQSVSAAILPCDMKDSGPDRMSELDMGSMDHSKHFSDDTAGSNEPSISAQSDCCMMNGECPMSSCLLVTTAAESSAMGDTQFSSRKIDFYSFALVNPLLSSPYRPPISR